MRRRRLLIELMTLVLPSDDFAAGLWRTVQTPMRCQMNGIAASPTQAPA